MAAVPAAASAALDEQVLDIVGRLVGELSGGSGQRGTRLEALDRDLGISSLERVELLLRLEQECGVRLPDSVMAEAATPRDLVEAIRRAGRSAAERFEPHAFEAAGRRSMVPTTVPIEARSLVEALHWHADRSPDRVHIHLRNDDGVEVPVTFGGLRRAAEAAGAGLRDLGVARGDRVALMLRTERDFFHTFLGAQLIGAVPVPLYPPVRSEDLLAYTRRQRSILRNAEARVLVTFAEAWALASTIRGHVPSLKTIVTADRLRAEHRHGDFERPAPADAALIQYTSGSTGDPKGVLLSHGNVLANIRAIGEAFEIQPDDVAVSWLPLYHDMGLIGLWLGALYFGKPVAIMSPLAFLSRPARWLRAIHAHRGTISAAPNFAYDLCARKIADSEIEGLDLSSWRIAVNGSEAISPDTIERFTKRFARYGFRAHCMCPAYGLAESSVALTLSALRRVPRIDAIARDPFQRAREIRPTPIDDPQAIRFVSCGRPLRDHDVRIVDDANRPVAERVQGHIHFRGPSVTRGYFRNAEATRKAAHDSWMDSGDLGYLAQGELFITGREKDLIIQGGRNLCAEEIEAIASQVPGIRPNCVAAFGVPDAATGTERVVVVAETRDPDPDRRESLRRAVRDALVTGIGSPPDVVVIAEPRTVLKTSSGKIRRSATRAAYVNGTLGRQRSPVVQRLRLVTESLAGRIERSADWLGRALFTAWIWFVLGVSLPVLWTYLALRGPGRHADRAAKLWSRCALTACGLRPQVVGLEHLQGIGSAVLVVNHASYIDPVVMMAAIPCAFHFVAKRALVDYPLIGTVIRKAQHVTIEKAGLTDRLAGADEVGRQLREGERLVVFAEGTFVRRPGLLPFRLGAFRAAVDAGMPVVPVALAGTRTVLPDETRLFRHAPITVTIGAPLEPRTTGWPEMVRLRNAAVDHIARACGETAAATS